MSASSTAHDQVPSAGELYLDHLGHWVPDMSAASARLEQLGFQLTPLAVHMNPDPGGGPPLPAGSSNRCIMLDQGYLEILTPSADTPVGRELNAGIDRYVGVHLIAFGTRDAAATRERLLAQGYPQQTLVDLRRKTELEGGTEAELRFAVARPQIGSVPEGRIQFVTHYTPESLWQRRYVEQANGARALSGLYIAVADVDEAIGRYAGYLQRTSSMIEPIADAASAGRAVRVQLERGFIVICDRAWFESQFPLEPLKSLPCIGAYALESADLAETRARIVDLGEPLAETRACSATIDPRAGRGIVVAGGSCLGSQLVFWDRQ